VRQRDREIDRVTRELEERKTDKCRETTREEAELE
jgi:hypothetical protein